MAETQSSKPFRKRRGYVVAFPDGNVAGWTFCVQRKDAINAFMIELIDKNERWSDYQKRGYSVQRCTLVHEWH